VSARWVRSALAVRACEIATGVILAWAGLAKIGDLPTFASQVHNFRILPLALENLAAMTLPWIEIVTALTLLTGVRSRAGARAALGLLVVFTIAVVLAVVRGLDIECGCFGTADATRVGWTKIAENVGLIVIAAIAAWGPLEASAREARLDRLATRDARP
jgi:putative oxidoreductase